MRHGRVLFQLFFLLGALLLAVFGAAQEITVGNRAREIQNSAIVIDTHEDTPQRFLDENYDIASTDPKDPEFISLDKARAGNLGALFFSIWVNPQSNQGHFAQRTLRLIDSVYAQAERHPDRITMSFSADDIERSHVQHKLAVLMGIEGGHSIESDLGLLRDFYRLGVRYMTLTWSNTNEWADSSGDLGDRVVTHHNGLTGTADGGSEAQPHDDWVGQLLLSRASQQGLSGSGSTRPREAASVVVCQAQRCGDWGPSGFRTHPCINCWASSALPSGRAMSRGRHREPFSESRMPETGLSGSMSGV